MRDLADLFEPVYSASEIGEIENLAAGSLMERAGLAVAEFSAEEAKGNRALVLAGPGNNGGDAFVAARHLKSWGFDVALVFVGEESRLPRDAAQAYRAWIDSGGACLFALSEEKKWDFAVDGLFGTGLKRPVSDEYRDLIGKLNSLGLPVFSIDVPSGIGSDTGKILGTAVNAAHTLTFIGLKPGLLTSDGVDHCGKIHLDKLGLSPIALKAPGGFLSNSKILRASFGKRPRNSHKGMFGSTAVIGGAKGMLGAAILAARAALKLGSGRVIMACDVPLDLVQPEIMVGDIEALMDSSTIVVGPGLGKSQWAMDMLRKAIDSEKSLVIDADALNLIASSQTLQQSLASRKGAAILTPHPAEAGRLLGCTAKEVQEDRVGCAKEISSRFGCPVVLKGAGSLCAFPDGYWVINASGNPGLAQAGMGDVLSGMIGAFLSQGLAPDRALLCAVHLHGAAADSLAGKGIGPIGMAASELIEEARALLNGCLL